MIKANELRIGNRLSPRRVIVPENIPLLGYKICAAHIAYSHEELNSDWEPIPLTPEILGKLHVTGVMGYRLFKNTIRDGSGDYDGYIAVIPRGDSEGLKFLLKVSYVHQLQNLFFALTGEELNISL